MIGINRVTLLGRVAADPEKKATKSGKSLTRLVVAIPGRVDGQETVEYFHVVTWEAQAEACGKYVTKGMAIYVEGRLKKRVWEDNKGQKKSEISIHANRVVFLGGGEETRVHDSDESQPREEAA